MTERKPQRNRRGFTLTEVLLALAILIILLALVMIPISRHQRNIRQSELDSKAETIYLAAQNRLSQLQASGRSDEYGKDRATALNNIPWDAEQDKYTTSTLYYVTSAAKSTDTSAAGSILPREQVEAELWDANWVIEYDPGSGSVYAVFYSEKPMQYSFDAFNPLRSRDRRVQEGATVGYYGGDSVQSEDTGKLTPKMEIINKRLQDKYRALEENEVRYEAIGCDDAEWVIVAFGSSARICSATVEMARAEGLKVGLLRPITLYPFPKKQIAELAARGVRGFLSAELNAGQMVEDVRLAVNGKAPVEHYGRQGGMLFNPDEVLDALKEKLINK